MRHKTLALLIFFSTWLAACNALIAPPTSTPAPTAKIASPTATTAPTPTAPRSSTPATLPSSTPAVMTIEPENAARVRQAAQLSVSNPTRLIWSLDSKSLGVMNQTELFLFNALTLQPSAHFASSTATQLAFSSDGHTLALVSDKDVELRDATTGQVLHTLKPTGQTYGAVFSPDGRMLALASADQIAVTLWDVASGQQTRKLTGFQTAAPVYSVSFASDGRTLIWLSRGLVQLMDLTTGKLGAEFRHEDFVTGAALTPDGKILATAAAGMVGGKYTPLVKLWDAAGGKELGILIQAEGSGSIAFSPNGKILAAASGKTVRLWDVSAKKEIANLTGHADGINAVAFSPDGRTLASAASDSAVKLWRVAP